MYNPYLPLIMIVSDSKKFIFISNPKTGGTSLHLALYRYGNLFSKYQENIHYKRLKKYLLDRVVGNIYTKHTPAWRVKKYLSTKWRKYFTFGVVRNPYNRAYSYYRFIQKCENHELYQQVKNQTFKEYVFSLKSHRWIDYQYYYFCENKKLIIDYVVKMESLQQEIDAVKQRLGVIEDIEIPHTNSTEKKSDYLSYYSREMIDEINRIFHDDFEIFGYKKV